MITKDKNDGVRELVICYREDFMREKGLSCFSKEIGEEERLYIQNKLCLNTIFGEDMALFVGDKVLGVFTR